MTDKTGVMSHQEVLELLSARAREGSVSAAIALERALRATATHDEDDFNEELERLMNDD